MVRRIGCRLGMTALAFLLAAGFYLGSPAPRLEASTCGDGTNLCSATQECVSIIFYKICTTRYKYWPPSPPLRDAA